MQGLIFLKPIILTPQILPQLSLPPPTLLLPCNTTVPSPPPPPPPEPHDNQKQCVIHRLLCPWWVMTGGRSGPVLWLICGRLDWLAGLTNWHTGRSEGWLMTCDPIRMYACMKWVYACIYVSMWDSGEAPITWRLYSTINILTDNSSKAEVNRNTCMCAIVYDSV